MPALETGQAMGEKAENEPQQVKPMSGPIIGIIYPPPEVRSKSLLNYIPFHSVKQTPLHKINN